MAMRFVLALMAATISASASAEECKIIGQIAYCHDWTKDKAQPGGKVDWNSPIKQYGIGESNFNNNPSTLGNTIAPPSYSDDKLPSYPFGNSVDFGNGVACQRNGVAINCKQ
jgi:hypothetical protein